MENKITEPVAQRTKTFKGSDLTSEEQMWVVLAALVVFVGCSMIWGYYKTSAHVAPTEVARLRRHLLENIHLNEPYVAICHVNEGFTDAELDARILELKIDIECAKSIRSEGNTQARSVSFGDASYSCMVQYNPLERHQHEVFRGAKSVIAHLESNPTDLATFESRISGVSSHVKFAEISKRILVDEELIMYLEDLKKNDENGQVYKSCGSETTRASITIYMCSHVLLYQLPLSEDCYKKDTVPEPYITLINSFERGNVSEPEESAKLTVFNQCRDIYQKLLKNMAIDYNGEREKRMADLRSGKTYLDICPGQ